MGTSCNNHKVLKKTATASNTAIYKYSKKKVTTPLKIATIKPKWLVISLWTEYRILDKGEKKIVKIIGFIFKAIESNRNAFKYSN